MSVASPFARARSLFTVVGVAAVAACTTNRERAPQPTAGVAAECAPTAGFSCANAIDAVVLPILAADGVVPERASDAELCRRYAIDLTGVAPSWADYQSRCAGKTPAQIVDAYLAQPEYVRTSQRWWADSFQYDDVRTWYRYIVDLDEQVGRLYRGALSYPEFAAIAVAHPAFVSEFVGENVVAQAYLVFLGRDALPEERQDLLALYRPWAKRAATDPDLGVFKFNACTTDADCGTKADKRVCVAGTCVVPTNYTELYLDPTRCTAGIGALGCTSAMHAASVNLPGAAPIALGDLTAEQWDAVRAPGRVIASLPSFWESGADRALTRYLGWWHAGFELPRYDLAGVRLALGKQFREHGGDVRALDREILTSVLYTMAATPKDPSDAVYWHHGPTKQMIAEGWLDSAARIGGVDIGRCDWRFPNTTARWLPASLVPPAPGLKGFDYVHEARILGGCPDQIGQLRTTSVGVLSAMEQRSILASICAHADPKRVTAADPQALVQQLWREALLIDPRPVDVRAIASTLPGADAATGIALCEALLRTNPYLFY